jgi:carboxymethylenebutenolidase
MTSLRGTMIDFSDCAAYLTTPSGARRGAIIVIHEIWGLNDHTKDVADRLAAQGYLAIAPDILSHGGITPAVGAEMERVRDNEAERIKLQPMLRQAAAPVHQPEYASWAVGALRQVADYLLAQPGVDQRLACTGFCFGGTYTWALAVAEPRLRAAAPFYGTAPDPAGFSQIRAGVHAFYGRADPTLMEALPAVEQGLRAAGVRFEATIYEQAGHAFFNDTSPSAYQPDAAADAWDKLLRFLAAELG